MPDFAPLQPASFRAELEKLRIAYVWSGTEPVNGELWIDPVDGVDDGEGGTIPSIKAVNPGTTLYEKIGGVGGGGGTGTEVELQANATHIQWRYVGDATWINLVALSSLEGAQGTSGILVSETPPTDTDVLWYDPTDQPPEYGVSFPSTGAITIVEITTGVWSADAPARAPGDNPIEFRGVSDPAGANGIATPANINIRDRWVELDSL